MVLELHELAAWVARVLAVAFVAGAAVVLASCSTGGNMGGTIADQMPTAIGGLPESAPQRPATPAAYPAVHNMPPPRASTVLTDQEQKRTPLREFPTTEHRVSIAKGFFLLHKLKAFGMAACGDGIGGLVAGARPLRCRGRIPDLSRKGAHRPDDRRPQRRPDL